MKPEQGEQGEVYKWVKASERLPEESGLYHCRAYGRNSLFTQDEIYSASIEHRKNLEWLCKLSSPPPEGQDWIKELEAGVSRAAVIMFDKDTEIIRLKRLIENVYKDFASKRMTQDVMEKSLQQFKTENNL